MATSSERTTTVIEKTRQLRGLELVPTWFCLVLVGFYLVIRPEEQQRGAVLLFVFSMAFAMLLYVAISLYHKRRYGELIPVKYDPAKFTIILMLGMSYGMSIFASPSPTVYGLICCLFAGRLIYLWWESGRQFPHHLWSGIVLVLLSVGVASLPDSFALGGALIAVGAASAIDGLIDEAILRNLGERGVSLKAVGRHWN
jgi:hypothetical protein